MNSASVNTPGQPSRLCKGRICLRPTRPDDCAFAVELESRPEHARHLGQWSETEHQACLNSPSWAHWTVEASGQSVGLVILQDVDDPDGNLLLRRIVVASKGRGHGRTTMLLVARYCFEVLGFHRLWLYVSVHNKRAYNFYRRLGFQQEGIARECSREGERRVSMYVLSLLEPEYRHRIAQ